MWNVKLSYADAPQPSGPDASSVENKHMVSFDASLNRWEVLVWVGCLGLALMFPVCCVMCLLFCFVCARSIVHAIKVVKLRASVASCHLHNTMSKSVLDVEEHKRLAPQDSGSHPESNSIRPRFPQQCCFF
jgi:hypothetical protein